MNNVAEKLQSMMFKGVALGALAVGSYIAVERDFGNQVAMTGLKIELVAAAVSVLALGAVKLTGRHNPTESPH